MLVLSDLRGDLLSIAAEFCEFRSWSIEPFRLCRLPIDIIFFTESYLFESYFFWLLPRALLWFNEARPGSTGVKSLGVMGLEAVSEDFNRTSFM